MRADDFLAVRRPECFQQLCRVNRDSGAAGGQRKSPEDGWNRGVRLNAECIAHPLSQRTASRQQGTRKDDVSCESTVAGGASQSLHGPFHYGLRNLVGDHGVENQRGEATVLGRQQSIDMRDEVLARIVGARR